MEDFKMGDDVTCVLVGSLPTSRANANCPPLRLKCPPLRLHADYKVNKVHVCECGCVSLDVGLGSSDGEGTICGCGATTSPKTGIWWCAAQRFAKKRKNYTRAEYDRALENEEYEKLREMKENMIE